MAMAGDNTGGKINVLERRIIDRIADLHNICAQNKEDPMTKLDQLLTDARSLEDQARQDRTAHLAAQCEAARAAVIAAFDGLWDEIAPYCDGGNYYVDDRKTDVTFWWTTVSLPGYAPFIATWGNSRLGANAGLSLRTGDNPHSGFGVTSFEALPEFLLERRREGEKLAAKAMIERLAELSRKLDGCDSRQRAATRLEADEVLGELLALDPGGERTWVKLHMDWQLWRNAKEEEQREEKARLARRAAAADEYRIAYAVYLAEYRRVSDANRARLEALQAELDTPVGVYRLTYAVGVENDGEMLCDTNTAYVLSDKPDPDGYYVALFNHGALRRMKYTNIVSFEGPISLLPSEGNVCERVRIGSPRQWDWFDLHFDPTLDTEEIKRRADSLLDAWPVEPAEPANLNWSDSEAIRRQVAEGAPEDRGGL